MSVGQHPLVMSLQGTRARNLFANQSQCLSVGARWQGTSEQRESRARLLYNRKVCDK